LFVTVAADKACQNPVGPTCLRELDAGVEASGPHDFAVRSNISRQLASRSLTENPALRSPRAPNAAASTASRPNVRDDGQRPSWGQDGAGYKFDLGLRRSGIFLQRGLDGQFTDLPVGQISGWIPPASLQPRNWSTRWQRHPSLLPIASNNVCCASQR
jgi:hypothetical protein